MFGYACAYWSFTIIPSGYVTIVNTDIFWDLDSGCYCKRERIYLLIYSILFNNITVVGGIDNTVSITPIPMWVSGGRATALVTTIL